MYRWILLRCCLSLILLLSCLSQAWVHVPNTGRSARCYFPPGHRSRLVIIPTSTTTPSFDDSSTRLFMTDRSMIDLAATVQTTTTNPMMDISSNMNVAVITIIALLLAVAAQGWIHQMVQGDQGLGAYLRDGNGFQKSAFQPMNKKKELSSSDPLPWLKLPNLDFVEVAGQSSSPDDSIIITKDDSLLLDSLVQMQQNMNAKLQEGKEAEARIIRNELERLMKDHGMEYTTEN